MFKLLYNHITSLLVGFIDGIIIPLTLLCFMTGMGKDRDSVVPYTMYITVAAAIILALGGFFTRREALSNTHDKTILKVYQGLDVADAIKEDLINDAKKESIDWKNIWDTHAVKTEPLAPLPYAAHIFIGYVVGGLIVWLNTRIATLPSFTYFILPLTLLAISGYAKYSLLGRHPFGGMLLTAGSGAVAALGAYWIGTIF